MDWRMQSTISEVALAGKTTFRHTATVRDDTLNTEPAVATGPSLAGSSLTSPSLTGLGLTGLGLTGLGLTDLGFRAQLRAGQLGRRLPQLLIGLMVFGLSIALMVRSDLGASPWDVFHTGVTNHVPLSIGQVTIAVSFVILLLWLALGERMGIGTIGNALIVGASADVFLAFVDTPSSLAVRIAMLLVGIFVSAFATAVYVGAQLGRGPRDGLMTGIARRTGWSIRAVRTALELMVIAGGLALGGVAGVGTIAFAVSIGPLAQWLIPKFAVDLPTQLPAGDVVTRVSFVAVGSCESCRSMSPHPSTRAHSTSCCS
jgi:uncharacterized membrane protein YczE